LLCRALDPLERRGHGLDRQPKLASPDEGGPKHSRYLSEPLAAPRSVPPVHEQGLDFAKGLVGFGGIGLAVIDAVQKIQGPRGSSPNRARL
jgi:hypothetical protein